MQFECTRCGRTVNLFEDDDAWDTCPLCVKCEHHDVYLSIINSPIVDGMPDVIRRLYFEELAELEGVDVSFESVVDD